MFAINFPVLMYHQITLGSPSKNLRYAMSVSRFKRQMDYLHNNGYKCVPPTEILQDSHSWQSRRRKAIFLTFDDGYENFFTLAYPILRDYGFTATLFVITDRIHGQNDLEREVDRKFLTWEQIETLRQNGISFGSHTCSHLKLPSLSREEIRRELVDSKKILEARLGEKIRWLSYPHCESTREIQKMAEVAGYTAAFGGSRGRSGRFYIWRRACYRNDTLLTFVLRLNRWYHYPGYIREETVVGRFLHKIKRRIDL